MTSTDELLSEARAYEAAFDQADLPRPPRRKVAIVACMDARLNPYDLFGLGLGDGHMIRNAGGAVTDDTIRSLTISQRLLGTEEIILVHHTECGMLTFSDEEFREQLRTEVGVKPPWDVETVADLDTNVRRSLARILASPFLPHKTSVRGFVYDVNTGGLREVLPG